jgi:hypothetical protein
MRRRILCLQLSPKLDTPETALFKFHRSRFVLIDPNPIVSLIIQPSDTSTLGDIGRNSDISNKPYHSPAPEVANLFIPSRGEIDKGDM